MYCAQVSVLNHSKGLAEHTPACSWILVCLLSFIVIIIPLLCLDTPSSVSSPGPRRRMMGPGPVTRVLSSESLSSGYMTDQYLPVDTETLDTGDYELWERVQQQEKRNFLQEQRKHYMKDPQQDQANHFIQEDFQQQQLQQQQRPAHHHNPAQRQRREQARAAQYVVS